MSCEEDLTKYKRLLHEDTLRTLTAGRRMQQLESSHGTARNYLRWAFHFARQGKCADALRNFLVAGRIDQSNRSVEYIRSGEIIEAISEGTWEAIEKRLAALCGGVGGEPRPGSTMKPFKLLEIEGALGRRRRRRR